jgi:hypothetical protein
MQEVIKRGIASGSFYGIAEIGEHILLRGKGEVAGNYNVQIHRKNSGEHLATITRFNEEVLEYQKNINHKLGIVLKSNYVKLGRHRNISIWDPKDKEALVREEDWNTDFTWEQEGLQLAIPTKRREMQVVLGFELKENNNWSVYKTEIKDGVISKNAFPCNIECSEENRLAWGVARNCIYLVEDTRDGTQGKEAYNVYKLAEKWNEEYEMLVKYEKVSDVIEISEAISAALCEKGHYWWFTRVIWEKIN